MVVDNKLEVELNQLVHLGAATTIQHLMDFTQNLSSANYYGKRQALQGSTEELKPDMEKFNTSDKDSCRHGTAWSN